MKLRVVQCNTINLYERKLKDKTSPEFITFMEYLNIGHESEYDKKERYKKFVDLEDDGRIRIKDLSWMTMRKFTVHLRLWAEYRDEIAGYKARRSNGKEFSYVFP